MCKLGKPAGVLALAAVCAIGVALLASAADDDSKSSRIGRQVKEFALTDVRGKEFKLDDFRDAKLLVVAFLGTECPVARLYTPRLAKLAADYAPQGVAVLAVNANSQDSLADLTAFAREFELTMPLLKDVGNRLADELGAVRTPEVFVLDAERKVRYWGRIDDQYHVGAKRSAPTRRDLAEALDALLAGKEVETPVIAGVGCHIGRVRTAKSDSSAGAEPITFSNQIARLLQNRCVECHRPGEVGPFSLTEYEEVAGWAETIAEVVRDGRMPPWHASPEHGTFANDRRLTDDEKDLIARWVKAGAPEGDRSQLPPPREFVSGWQLPRQPDQVIEMRDQPFSVPAEGEVRYQHFAVDPGWTEDRWIEAAEVQPSARAVVHHIIVFLHPPRESRHYKRDHLEQILAAYVPGLRLPTLPEGTARFVPAGSRLQYQVHYTPNGASQEDLSRLGLIFTDRAKVKHALVGMHSLEPRFEIPAGAADHRVEAHSRPHEFDGVLLGMGPHMHLRGKAFSYEAIFPDGRREMLLDVPRYDFNWQTSYRLAKPMPVPAGTRMHCVGHFDNSAENLANPDPKQNVRWGDQTWEEMMIGFYELAVPVDDFLAHAEAKRKAEASGDPEPADPKEDPAARAQRLFLRFDRDQSGKISKEELPAAIRPALDKVDKNSDGEVDLAELTAALEAQAKQK